ncbi:hypothetical protein N665_0273s0021 [Sinapis alba]|nr:hypothetical protein N665_0273s0021 [Sinapis alba]
MDSTNPYSQTSNFVDLLNSQQDSVLPEPYLYESFSHGREFRSSQLPVFSTQCTETSSFCENSPTKRKEREKWTLSDDVVLISAWLNTSKDPVVGNEQKATSPKVERGEKRETIQCKQRWQKMNDLNENDIVKLAHEIFYNDHKIKFNLHHAWEELRNDQKWCEFASSKIDGSAKKRRFEDGAQSSTSQATTKLGDQPTKRPLSVKASKRACGKRTIVDHQAVSEFHSMWSIKEKDLTVKERLLKISLLDSLISKKRANI